MPRSAILDCINCMYGHVYLFIISEILKNIRLIQWRQALQVEGNWAKPGKNPLPSTDNSETFSLMVGEEAYMRWN